MTDLTTPIAQNHSNPKTTDNSKGIENHKKAAKHHEEAAKNHLQAIKHHEAGEAEKATKSTVIANGHHHLAGEANREVLKHHALNN